MFCISLANLRKWVKIPYNLLKVNEDFECERNDKSAEKDNFYRDRQLLFKHIVVAIHQLTLLIA